MIGATTSSSEYATLITPRSFARSEAAGSTSVAGRPHWGKLHSLDTGRLRALYPRYDEFRRVRADVDPDPRFGSAYLTQVLGHPAQA
jgi:hypothetical protein